MSPIVATLTVAAGALVSSGGFGGTALATNYSVKVIGASVPSNLGVNPIGMNNRAEIVGRIVDSSKGITYDRPFVYANGRFKAPTVPSGLTGARFRDVNDGGLIAAVGIAGTSSYPYAARFAHGKTSWKRLKGPKGQAWTGDADSVNGKGQLAGFLNTTGYQQAAIWSPKKGGGYATRLLGYTPNFALGYGYDINGFSDVVGTQVTSVNNYPYDRATIWLPNGHPHLLPGYNGRPTQSGAAAVETSGSATSRTLIIAGSVMNFGGDWNPCFWKVTIRGGNVSTGKPVIPPSVKKATYPYDVGYTNDISSSGEIVGSTVSGPFSWQTGQDTTELQAQLPAGSGWSIGYGDATAVNDKGQIAGVGSYNSDQRAFLLTPS